MVTVNITDATTVSTPGGSVTGPAWFRASEFTLSSTTRTDGVWVVTSAGAVETMQLQPEHLLAMPYAVSFFFLLGLASGWFKTRLLAVALPLLFACNVQAAAVYRHYEVVRNTNNDSRSYRVSMFEQVVVPGTTVNQWIPTVVQTSNATATHYVQYKIYVNGAEVHTSAMIANPNGLGASWAGVANYVGPTQTSASAFTSRSITKRIWSTSLGGAWGSYNSLGAGEIGSVTSETTGGSVSRGGLISQWPFELAANASITLDLVHPTPFLVAIEELKQFATPDGGFAYGYEALEPDIQSTTHTAATAEPDYQLDPGEPEYEPPAAPTVPATTPPNAVADTTAKADQNEAARDNDQKTLLGQIRDAQTENVNTTTAGLASLKAAIEGTGPPGSAGDQAATDDADFETAKAGAEDTVAELGDALSDLQATLLGMLGMYDVNITGSDYPAIGIQLPAQLGGDYVAFDLESYAWLWSIIRFALLCGIGWYALNDAIQTVRGALA